MKRSSVLSVAAGMVLGSFLLVGAGTVALAEDSVMIQDFEAPTIALGAWGSLQSELVDDDSGVSGKALHISFEPEADQWAGVTVPLDEFTEDYNTLRFRYKGTASKFATIMFLYDAGEERFSYTYLDKVAGWTTVEVPLKRFVLDGWQAENATKNKKKDFPLKYMALSRDGNMKRGNDYCIDEIEVVKR